MALRADPGGPVNLDTLLDEIADRVAERLLPKLKSISPPAAVVYTTHKSGPHIPRKSRRWMLEHISKMPGARKVGRDWLISAADYDAWQAAEDARRCALAAKPKPPRGVKAAVLALPSNDISYPNDEAELQQRMERSLHAQGLRRSR